MNKNMQLAIDALRSQSYRQGFKWLRNASDEYCVLGVLCDVYRQQQRGQWSTSEAFHGVLIFMGCHSSLPQSVAAWYGLRTRLGVFGDTYRTSLSRLNDSGATFAQIADIIEEQPCGLFKFRVDVEPRPMSYTTAEIATRLDMLNSVRAHESVCSSNYSYR